MLKGVFITQKKKKTKNLTNCLTTCLVNENCLVLGISKTKNKQPNTCNFMWHAFILLFLSLYIQQKKITW